MSLRCQMALMTITPTNRVKRRLRLNRATAELPVVRVTRVVARTRKRCAPAFMNRSSDRGWGGDIPWEARTASVLSGELDAHRDDCPHRGPDRHLTPDLERSGEFRRPLAQRVQAEVPWM